MATLEKATQTCNQYGIVVDYKHYSNISLATALAAAQTLYGPSFNPEITLKALSFFDDGNLHELPDELKQRLVTAAREVDLDHLPNLTGEFRLSDNGNEP